MESTTHPLRSRFQSRQGHARTASSRAGWTFLRMALCAALGMATAHAQVPRVAKGRPIGEPVTPLVVSVDMTNLVGDVSPLTPVTTREEGSPMPFYDPPPRDPLADPFAQILQLAGVGDSPDSFSAPNVNIAGISSGSGPPDTTGDVGRDHFVQMVNATFFQVFDKRGGALTPALNFGNLWPVGHPCRRNDGDPIVVYDHLADRWLLSQFRNGGAAPNGAGDGTNCLCVAISRTPDPTAGTWFLYKFDTGQFPDYPKYGVWPDAYYVTTYESPNLGAYVMERANMVAGTAARILMTTIPALGAANVRDTRLLPADLDGPPPPPGTPGFFVRTVDHQQDPANPNDRIEVFEGRVNWLTPSFSLVLVNTLTPAAFNTMLCNRNAGGIRDCIPQPNTTATVDALSNRSMMQLKYRNFGAYWSMVFNQTIDVSGTIPGTLGFTPANEVAGIRWYELIRAGVNWSIGQQGTFAPQPNGATTEAQLLHRWMGSMAMNGRGDIAIGYSIVNDDDTNPVFPGIRFAGRRLGDGPGLLPQAEGVILNGANSAGANGAFGTRWGDYSQMGVDPVDDCTFWFTTHDANGNTRIASMSIGSACAAPKITIPGSVTFADTCVGETNYATLYICNTGKADLEVTNITSSNARFAVATPSSGFPLVISPDFCFPVRVRFAPTDPGPDSTLFTVQSNDPLSPTSFVQGTGLGLQPLIATLIADSGNFGNVCVGSFKDLPLIINNSGGCDLYVTNVTSSSGHFLVPGVMHFPLVVHPGDSLQLPIRFQPTNNGAKLGTITIESRAPAPNIKMVSVSGHAPTGDIRVTGSTDFGRVCAGQLAEKIISICNVGLCDLRVTNVYLTNLASLEPCHDFTLINSPFPAAVSHDFCIDLVIRFTPTNCGPKTCTVVILSDDPDQGRITLTLTADAPCAVIDVPPDLGFAPEVVQTDGACTTSLPFPISNNGECNLYITDIRIGGVNAADFRLSGLPSFPIILQPGHIAGEGDLEVVFAPTAIDRDREATLTVTYLIDPVAGTSASITRKLCGEGVHTGARVLVTQNGIPLAQVERIHLQRINANRNKDRLDTQDNVMRLPLVTVIPAAPCEPFQYHREYGTLSNPIQLLPGSYQITVSAIINGKRQSKTIGFDVDTCDFNANIVVDF